MFLNLQNFPQKPELAFAGNFGAYKHQKPLFEGLPASFGAGFKPFPSRIDAN